MKKIITSVILSLLCLFVLISLASCAGKVPEGLWEKATYTSDKEFGSGAATVKVDVKIDEKTITLTLHTDKNTLGDALLEHDLIAGDPGQYGLYVKTVNGVTADYDTDKAYWGFYKDGEYLPTGVDSTDIKDGEHYEIVYSK